MNTLETMRETLRLMQTGDLQAATRAIQQRLRRNAEPPMAGSPPVFRHGALPDMGADCIDAEFTVVERPRQESPKGPRGPVWQPGGAFRTRSDGNFQMHEFSCAAGSIPYKLFIPNGLDGAPAPLLLMLHGCTQSPDDFARGTRMNTLAQRHGYVVAYPAQTAERNPNKCWNWFRSGDQQRGRGEPALLAELSRHLLGTHRLDEHRVYAAGLSAGGAMAAVLASTYPDVFAAIGVHSGLPVGLAHNLPSAFAAMREGRGAAPAAGRSGAARSEPVPTIVFHGDGDTTVHPSNGDDVIEQCLGATHHAARTMPGSNTVQVERGVTPGGRRYTRTLHSTPDGRVAAEHWVIHGAPHAWSGGDPRGTYTDPSGPDASAEMLRFFAACTRSGGA